MFLVAKFRVLEPIGGKLRAAVGHILPAKNAKLEHLLRREFGLKLRIEVLAFRLREKILIAVLHEIGYRDPNLLHAPIIMDNGGPVKVDYLP